MLFRSAHARIRRQGCVGVFGMVVRDGLPVSSSLLVLALEGDEDSWFSWTWKVAGNGTENGEPRPGWVTWCSVVPRGWVPHYEPFHAGETEVTHRCTNDFQNPFEPG